MSIPTEILVIVKKNGYKLYYNMSYIYNDIATVTGTYGIDFILDTNSVLYMYVLLEKQLLELRFNKIIQNLTINII